MLPVVMLVLALVVLACAVPTAGAVTLGAGYQWYWLDPTPQGNPVEDIDFATATRGWAVGPVGTILTTTNGGASWQPQTSRSSAYLRGVSFPTTLKGWAVGLDGVILRTVNGGRSWAAQKSGTTVHLEAVAFADASRGWAVGGTWDGPVVLRTTDGGAHWTPQETPTASGLNDVTCVDATHAWAVGDGGSLLYTTDGGAEWQVSYLNGSSSYAFTAVAFSDGKHGWAVDRSGAVARTTDGGKTWREAPQDVVTYGLEDVTSNGTRIWVAGPDGIVLSHMADGSGAWTTEDSEVEVDLSAVAARGTGVVAGGWAGALARSSGSGDWTTSWRAVGAQFQDASFVDPLHGWVAGMRWGGDSTALIYATSDGGRTWTGQLEDDAMNWLGGIAMADATHGWAAGWGGGIVHTSDGAAWTPQVAPAWPATNYDDVACGDDQHAVAVGYPGNGKNLSATADGGTTWSSPASGVTGELRDVDFADATHAWAVGDGGVITTSADAGASWTPQTSGVSTGLSAVDFVDALTGWAAGRDGVVLQTVDGGQTWTPQASGTTGEIRAIRFLTTLKGWAATGDGEILQTADGGQSWGNAGPRTFAGLEDLTVLDATHVLALGNLGTVLAMDVVRPIVKATAPAKVQHRAVTVRLKATDTQSGVASIQYRIGKGAWKTGSRAKVTRSGTTVVSCRAVDRAGNVSAIKKAKVRISR